MAQAGRGVVIGQSTCRLLESALEAIDSTRAGASGTSLSAATCVYIALAGPSVEAYVSLTMLDGMNALH